MKTKRRGKIFAYRLLSGILFFSLISSMLFVQTTQAATVSQAQAEGKKIGAGLHFTLVLKSDGRVAAWGGGNYFGQCNVPSGLSGVVAISAGYYHSLALKNDGTVAAWGRNQSGECNVPQGLSGVVAISGRGNHSLALKSDGTVAAWGDNQSGESNVPSGLSGVVAISAGYFHSLALKSDGTVAAWGDNLDGQCNIPPGLNGVVAISAGDKHSLALKSDGTVVAWGGNSEGQCNIPSGLSGVVAISTGDDHSLALKSDGTVAAWGCNQWGECNVPPGLSEVVAISGGEFHSLALKSDGTVTAFGNNGWGECNVPSGLNLFSTLSQLLTSQGTLSPAFDPGLTEYTIEVANSVTELDITAEMAVPLDYNLIINNQAQMNGVPKTFALTVGPNPVELDVVEKSTSFTCTYLITITRAGAQPGNADLSDLHTGSGLLTPSFSPATRNYTVNIDNAISNLPVTVTPADAFASTMINGQVLGSGTHTANINLNPGDNEITVVIRSRDRGNEKTYTLNVMRGPSSNALLSSLNVSTGSLNPVFSSGTVAYRLEGAENTDSIFVSAAAADPAATLSIAGQTVGQSVFQSVYLDQGVNLIPIVATAQDGVTQQCYIISVNGTVSNSNLGSLVIDGCSLNPNFDPAARNYTLAVPNKVDSLKLTAAPDDLQALMVLNGNLLSANTPAIINLQEGDNSLLLMVVAQDASTRTYTINVTREAALDITTAGLPIGIIGTAYSTTLTAAGGTAPYTWSAAGLPGGLTLDSSNGVISGTPADAGQYSVDITVTDANSNTSAKTLPLKFNRGCGNGGYLITPGADAVYTAGMTVDGIPTMTVNQGVTGFKYFSATIQPVTGHSGNETAVFVHTRNGQQIGINASDADFDKVTKARAGFNVRAGDVIKVYIVDELTNASGVNPVIL